MHAIAPTPPEPIRRPNVVLTQKGHATVALYRFTDLLAQLDRQEQAEVLGLFSAELHEHYAAGLVS